MRNIGIDKFFIELVQEKDYPTIQDLKIAEHKLIHKYMQSDPQDILNVEFNESVRSPSTVQKIKQTKHNNISTLCHYNYTITFDDGSTKTVDNS